MRRWAKRLLGGALLALVCAAAGEIALRTVLGPPGRLRLSLGRSFRDVQTDWDIEYGITPEGTRVTCGPGGALADRPGIAVIGDSFVFGQGVEDCQDFVSILSRGSPAARFRNFGMIGAGIQEYITVARDLLDGSDAALVVFYGNDVGRFKWDYSVLGRLSRYSTLMALFRKAWEALIVRRAQDAWRKVRGQGGATAGKIALLDGRPNNILSSLMGNPDYFRKMVEPEAHRVALFRSRFEDLAALLERRVGSERVVVTVVPQEHIVSRRVREFIVDNGGTVAPFGEPGAVYELIRSLADEHGFRFVDVFPGFTHDGDELYYPHDLHWSAKGHERMAELLSRSAAFESLVRDLPRSE